jgi:hypothetical protein
MTLAMIFCHGLPHYESLQPPLSSRSLLSLWLLLRHNATMVASIDTMGTHTAHAAAVDM